MVQTPPTDEQRSAVAARLDGLLNDITAHPQWNPSDPNPTLYYVWDFVNRSKYMLSEYENIKAGQPIQHPNQFQGGAGSGEKAAISCFQNVCGRTMMLDMMVNDTTGMMRGMTGGGPAVDYGQGIKNAVKALQEACPQEAIMAGMLN